MCGIFGVFLRPDASISHREVAATLAGLYHYSESRGKESAGLHVYLPSQSQAWTLKVAQRASDLLKSREYRKLTDGPVRIAFSGQEGRPSVPLAMLGHSRLVTNGTSELNENNQPVRWGGVTMIHNGIVVNVDELWAAAPHLQRHAQVDTEVMAALAADALTLSDPAEATVQVFSRIRGAASVAWTHERGIWIVLATNTGDLYRYTDTDAGFTIFASERYILDHALKSLNGAVNGSPNNIEWLRPGKGVLLTLDAMRAFPFELRGSNACPLPVFPSPSETPTVQHDVEISPSRCPAVIMRQVDEGLLRYGEAKVAALHRCTRCILPKTFPFISFDEQGVCNYCQNYRPRYQGVDPTAAQEKFIDSLKSYRNSKGVPDVLVAFSGGRDSSYGLHLIKKEFGLTPVTFTYDWGMVTDLARRNIARICGQLGIQNILVSADIKRKRDNIRKNVTAWLRRPELGLVPLFMAGDKHFFSVTNQLKRQTGIKLDLWCANPLENTDFKSGFCGVPPDFGKKRLDYLSFGRKLRMSAYYAYHCLANPGYFNKSIPDTVRAFFSYYVEPRRDFHFIYDHLVWDEREVNDVLLTKYNWELAPDTSSTWRIGDGTAPFYNYIYLTARGFSEFDTFRSNQIREGMIGREEALQAVIVENRPRLQSLLWYLETIGLDFNDVIRRINELDTFELHRG
ncbi:MAG TPA: hypothetical protein VI895_12625 [Bdellovibrionota bacterium]|nr:hypothetical protein [Bdellovibrionota bacterium]